MKSILQLILFFITFSMFGQNVVKTIDFSDEETLVRCFEELPENKYLDSIDSSLTKGKKFCYLWTCFSALSEKNQILNIEMHKRIKDIAQKLYSENKAILFIGGCKSYIEERNINGKIIQINNLGDCSGCMKFKPREKGIEIFNTEIKNLFGILD